MQFRSRKRNPIVRSVYSVPLGASLRPAYGTAVLRTRCNFHRPTGISALPTCAVSAVRVGEMSRAYPFSSLRAFLLGIINLETPNQVHEIIEMSGAIDERVILRAKLNGKRGIKFFRFEFRFS